MIEVREGNVVDALLNKEVDYIMHVVNCRGKMASGVAKEIRNRVPDVYKVYMEHHNSVGSKANTELGSCSHTEEVYNLHAQEYYGYDGKRYLNYGALAKSFSQACDSIYHKQEREHTLRKDLVVGIPFKMGSDRAGADFDIVCEILEGLKSYNMTIIAYKL